MNHGLQRSIRITTTVSIFFIVAVIIAGSVVRMSGSGMGCPDWPKCYGHLIPPTEAAQLEFQPEALFEKGKMIILNDTLWVANESFTTGKTFSRADWHKYPKHDYAIFNASHTWTEYVNRLIGALSGIPVLFLFILSAIRMFRKRDLLTFVLAALALFMLGFEAWLGKLVVDGNLKSGSITYHMLGSMAIVFLLLFIRHRFAPTSSPEMNDRKARASVLIFFTLIIIQILIGTQVRETVDELLKSGIERIGLMDRMSINFYIHRSYSILLLLVFIWMYRNNKQYRDMRNDLVYTSICVAGGIVAGIGLSYFGMPASLQPVHLVSGILIFLFTSKMLLRLFTAPLASRS